MDMERIGGILEKLEKCSIGEKYHRLFLKAKQMHESGYNYELLHKFIRRHLDLEAGYKEKRDGKFEFNADDICNPKVFVPFDFSNSKFLAMDGTMNVLVERIDGLYCVDLIGIRKDFLVSKDTNITGVCGSANTGFLISYGEDKLIFVDYAKERVISRIKRDWPGSHSFEVDIQIVGCDIKMSHTFMGIGQRSNLVYDIKVFPESGEINLKCNKEIRTNVTGDKIAVRIDRKGVRYALGIHSYEELDDENDKVDFIMSSKGNINMCDGSTCEDTVILYVNDNDIPCVAHAAYFESRHVCPRDISIDGRSTEIKINNIAHCTFVGMMVYVCDKGFIFV